MPLVLTLVLSFLKLVAGQWQVIAPDPLVKASVGEDIMFSCFLSPEMSAEAMEVRFFRNQFSAVVHMYRDGRDQTYMQMPAYRGRTEFMKDFIAKGHVSLKLKNITSLDAGMHGCWFSSQTYYQVAIWDLQVSGLGSTPLVSLMGYVDGGIQLLCQSSGWLPQPTVKWKGSQGQDLPSESKITVDRHGMFSVETSFTVKENAGSISCSIQHTDQSQEVQSSVLIGETFFQISPWHLACILLGILFSGLCVAVMGCEIFIFKFHRKLMRELEKRRIQGQAEWREARKHTVEVTLDPDTAHPQLHISDLKAVNHMDVPQEVPNSEKRFKKRECVVASQGFSSGKHYWEVDVGLKKRWQLGVCWDDVDRKGKDVILSPQNGYWILGLSKGDGYFTFNPRRICFPLKTCPTRVGIFLDYEGGKISFFHINEQSLIHTMTHQFEGLLRPFIEPWSYHEENHMPIVICPVSWESERKAPSQNVPTSPDTDSLDPCPQVTTPFLSRSDAMRES
ncbi:butyrophilin-like protein 8 [Orycteropus afer afer]|uniref:Butyrophilin-like protein 8 n=1 Tax=Orycteropus afer afer TaxID=1230840 RepID=A0A8B7AY31_ORYAF|nr:butyrophilin-like protein 8 [Orycteropus afer afer]